MHLTLHRSLANIVGERGGLLYTLSQAVTAARRLQNQKSVYAGMSPDGPSGWTLYAIDQQQKAERLAAERAFLRSDERHKVALPTTVPTPEMPPFVAPSPSSRAANGTPCTSASLAASPQAAASAAPPLAATSAGALLLCQQMAWLWVDSCLCQFVVHDAIHACLQSPLDCSM